MSEIPFYPDACERHYSSYPCVRCLVDDLRAENARLKLEVDTLRACVDEAMAVLRNRDRTTHRGLQWAHDLAVMLEENRAALGAAK